MKYIISCYLKGSFKPFHFKEEGDEMKSIEKWEPAWIKVEEKIHSQQSLLSGRQEKKLPFSDMFEMPSDIFFTLAWHTNY